jgi:AcrR family transcriptional regulator
MTAIAEAAGVSHETVYAAFGPKAAVLRHLLETALSGEDEPIAPLERDYARAVLSERDAGRVVQRSTPARCASPKSGSPRCSTCSGTPRRPTPSSGRSWTS